MKATINWSSGLVSAMCHSTRLAILAVLLVITATACDPDVDVDYVDPDVDDTFLATGSIREGKEAYVSKLHNPRLLGRVRIVNARIEGHPTGSDGQTVCCDRITITANGPYFVGDRSSVFPAVFADAGVSVETGEEDVYLFRTPTIRLPADGTPVTVKLERWIPWSGIEPDPDVGQTIRLQLDKETLVLPVHVHVFIPDRTSPIPDSKKERRFQTLLEPPPYFTSAASWRGEDGLVRTLLRHERYNPHNISPDDVWSKAGIQFALESYEVIPDRRFDRILVTEDVVPTPGEEPAPTNPVYL